MAENDFSTGYAIGRDTQSCGGYGGFGGYGSDWLWAIILLALVGNGGFGFGGGFGGGRGIGENYALATDFATIERKIDGVNNGLCDGFYAQNTNMLNGFASVQQTLCQGFSGVNATVNQGFAGVNNAICTLGYQNQAGFNSLATQLSSCCCETQRAIDGLKFENCQNTSAIINANNANTRAILDYLTSEKISALQAENSGLKAQISNDRQSAFIIDALAPKCPQPAYVVQPPQQVTFPTNCCGNIAYATYGSNCGCN